LVIYFATSRYQFLIYRLLLIVIFSASCVCPDILSIIRCSQSKSAWISRFLSTEQPWPQYIYSTSKYGAASLAEKAHDVDDLRQNLIDACVGVEKSVIDDGIDQWRRRLHACIGATGGHFKLFIVT